MRIATAHGYDTTMDNLNNRQAGLADLQEKLSAGKRVLRASDDPTAMAQAERAMNRIKRIETEQRMLSSQKNSIALAESNLGDSIDNLQTIRQLVLSAGNAAYTANNRTSLAQQMTSLRDELFSRANAQDTNGIPLYGGLGGPDASFTDAAGGVTFNGTPGQKSSSLTSIPAALDGQSFWNSVPSGNGTFDVSLTSDNTGTVYSDNWNVISLTSVTGHDYSITFTVSGGLTSYEVLNNTLEEENPEDDNIVTSGTYTSGQAILFDGISIVPKGTPADGDSMTIAPSSNVSLFTVLDDAINSINGASNSNVLTHAIGKAIAEIDAGMSRLQSGRGLAGDLLNRADLIDSNQVARTNQIQNDRSRAEDIDMVKGISDFQNQQTAYDAALKTYAQVQRLSLFTYMS
jgi:flagellar hook-associated protein 3 FlgL